MRRWYAFLPALVLVVVVGACTPVKLGAPSCTPPANFATEVLNATNDVRVQSGLSRLDWNPGLADQAQPWAEHMAAANDVRHSPWAHENIVGRWPCNTADELVASWMASTDGHRERILQPAFDSLGVGWTVDARGLWVVQQFV